MAEGVQRERWQHTASLLAMIAETNRDRKKRPSPFKSSDFDPFARSDRRASAETLDDLSVLKDAFTAAGPLPDTAGANKEPP